MHSEEESLSLHRNITKLCRRNGCFDSVCAKRASRIFVLIRYSLDRNAKLTSILMYLEQKDFPEIRSKMWFTKFYDCDSLSTGQED